MLLMTLYKKRGDRSWEPRSRGSFERVIGYVGSYVLLPRKQSLSHPVRPGDKSTELGERSDSGSGGGRRAAGGGTETRTKSWFVSVLKGSSKCTPLHGTLDSLRRFREQGAAREEKALDRESSDRRIVGPPCRRGLTTVRPLCICFGDRSALPGPASPFSCLPS